MKMPKQTAPVARNLKTTAQAANQNGIEASQMRTLAEHVLLGDSSDVDDE